MLSGVFAACSSNDRLIVSHWNDATDCGFHFEISKLISPGVITIDPSAIHYFCRTVKGNQKKFPQIQSGCPAYPNNTKRIARLVGFLASEVNSRSLSPGSKLDQVYKHK
jgi:hypothetical protein